MNEQWRKEQQSILYFGVLGGTIVKNNYQFINNNYDWFREYYICVKFLLFSCSIVTEITTTSLGGRGATLQYLPHDCQLSTRN